MGFISYEEVICRECDCYGDNRLCGESIIHKRCKYVFGNYSNKDRESMINILREMDDGELRSRKGVTVDDVVEISF